MNKRKTCIIITVTAIILLLACEIFGGYILEEISDETVRMLVNMTVTRAIGSVVFITILTYLGYKVMSPLKKPFGRSLLFTLPAILVVVNNLPIYPLSVGIAEVTSPLWKIILLAAECLFIGLFEEFCFRGVIFLGFLEKRRGSKRGQLMAIILTSAVFGAVHLVNLLTGDSPLAVLLQVGYSFLIGSMCAVILMKTKNIWLISLLHAVFDFCGALVPTCGEGTIWEPLTVTVTAVLAVFTAVYMTVAFLKIKPCELDGIYQKKRES